jgi:serine/threonine protein kinase
LEGLLELDPQRRCSAKEALGHEFFTRPEVEVGPDEEHEVEQ